MARNFDASSNDFVEIGDISALDLTGDEVTLSLWIRLGVPNDEYKMFAKWADVGTRFSYLLSVLANGHAQFATRTDSIKITEGTTDLGDGLWHHIAGTYDGSNMRIYVDGVEENSTAQTGNMVSNTAPVRIGAGSGGSGTENPFDGDLGHGSIWDVGLTAGEIKSLSVGISPRKIHRENLLSGPPLNGQNPEYDVVSGLDLTVTGTTVVGEPPIPNSIVAP